MVRPSPARKLRLILVGEAPGRSEEKTGIPFVGQSGQFVEARLREIGVARGECHLTNAALCRGDTDDENERAAECCAPRLLREVQALPADVPIVTLGKLATKSVLGLKSILKVRGFIWKAKTISPGLARAARKTGKPKDILRAESLEGRALLSGRTVLPTIHPAFVLRAHTWKPISQIDFRRVGRVLERGAGIIEDETNALVGKPSILSRLDTRKPISVDIETDGILPLECNILCVGLSDGETTVVIWPWRDSYAEALSRFLRKCSAVVMHNGFNFDQIVMGAHGVAFDGVELEDTLIAHHTFASHLPQNLAHVTTCYVDSSPWKITYGKRGEEEKGLPPNELPVEDLIKYNGIDARHTILDWNRMADDLAPEAAVYAHDKQLAGICRDMIRAGVGVDLARKSFLERLARNRRAALKGHIRNLLGRPSFNPGQLDSVRGVLFGSLKVRALSLTKKGLPSTSNLTLESVRGNDSKAGKFADLLLKWREVGKINSTYVEALQINPRTKRVHWNWKSFGTVSGRFASRLQSCPKHNKDENGVLQVTARPRELYIPAKGNSFVYFDISQGEMRAAAYLSNDAAFIEACQGDVHANNAKAVFPEVAAKGWLDGEAKKDSARGKRFRDIAKNLGFAISYYADSPTVFANLRANGFDVSLKAVESILDKLHNVYRTYYRYIESNLRAVQKCGYMRTAILGRIRWLGWYPKITDVANFPVQSCIADVMNLRTIEAARRLPRQARLVAQVHDACIYDVPNRLVPEVRKTIAEIWAPGILLAGGEMTLPIDLKVGQRWSEL